MTVYTSADRYLRGIIDTCQRLSGSINRSGVRLTDEEIGHLGDWLAWRPTDGWLPTPSDKPMASYRYDQAVRNLARATLIMVMSR